MGRADLMPEYLPGPGDGVMLMLYHEDTPVGTLAVSPESPGTAELGNLAILPSYQGRGLGTNLLREGMATATGMGLTTMVLSVAAGAAPV